MLHEGKDDHFFEFHTGINTRFLQINVKSYQVAACMKIEVFGCRDSKTKGEKYCNCMKKKWFCTSQLNC